MKKIDVELEFCGKEVIRGDFISIAVQSRVLLLHGPAR